MRIPFLRGRSAPGAYAGGIAIEGDAALVVVCGGPSTRDDGILRFDRETSIGDLARTLDEAESLMPLRTRGARIDWTFALGGEGILHEVVTVPPQVRAFREVRLEASLAATSWGNTDALAAAGYRLASTFLGNQCLLAVAPEWAFDESRETCGRTVGLTSTAAALVELVRAVRSDAFEDRMRPSLVMLCGTTTVACCAIEGGEVRLLHQVDLASYVRELSSPAAAPAASVSADAPLEFEFGAAYTQPRDVPGARPASSPVERLADDIETDAYQSAITRVVQDILTLYREQYGASVDLPTRLLLTGSGVARHAVLAFAVRYLGSQFDVEELDAALLVRIDEPETARRFAGLQNLFSSALAAIAVCRNAEALVFRATDEAPAAARVRGRSAVDTGQQRTRRFQWAVGLAVAGILALGGIGLRAFLVDRERRQLSAALSTERARQAQLNAITAERKQVEARLAHARALLASLESLRGAQAVPPAVLESLQSCIPADVELDELGFSGSRVRLAGSASAKEKAVQLALALEQRPDIFSDVVPEMDARVASARDAETGERTDEVRHTFVITARYGSAPSSASRSGR